MIDVYIIMYFFLKDLKKRVISSNCIDNDGNAFLI